MLFLDLASPVDHHQQRRAHRAGDRRSGAAAGRGIGTGKRGEQAAATVMSANRVTRSNSSVSDAAALDDVLDHRAADANQVGQHAGDDHRVELLAGLEAADRVLRDRSTPRR